MANAAGRKRLKVEGENGSIELTSYDKGHVYIGYYNLVVLGEVKNGYIRTTHMLYELLNVSKSSLKLGKEELQRIESFIETLNSDKSLITSNQAFEAALEARQPFKGAVVCILRIERYDDSGDPYYMYQLYKDGHGYGELTSESLIMRNLMQLIPALGNLQLIDVVKLKGNNVKPFETWTEVLDFEE
ncbi:hypothetical protein [Bacillus sp. V59.32b]|uniref:hypothetical protein n=1 Tax=Bacillus sp. V59.32b TaxID=1758642 RepID=UPI000E3E6AB8|nr:hypothetical protein [Bacillus sp. V59.32b]RFU68400.1 hypothetical protein D0463_05095 [Bacillus sp. V59.32b]